MIKAKGLAVIKKTGILLGLFFTGLTGLGTGLAQEGRVGIPADRQISFQEPATETMQRILDFHDGMLMYIITAITLLVIGLLIWVMIRYNRRSNPEPSRTSHNTLIEIIWTAIPILILAFIAVPSMRLLYFQDTVPEADLVVQATGHQWFWTYDYPDYEGVSFAGIMVDDNLFDDDLTPEQRQQKQQVRQDIADFLGRDELPELHRLLDTDTRIVVPVGQTVKILVTASDVLHAWTIPAFGIKMDAVPGRFNETWFRANEIGTYYGQCSELCGIRHAFMPIVVEVVSQEDFEAWINHYQQNYASLGGDTSSRFAETATHESN